MARVVKSAEDRRLEIIQTSERMFREVGYANCSVEMIIREIGVAKGTFYYYFRSKEDILEAIVDHTLAQVVETVERVADDPGLSALAKFQALLTNTHVSEIDTSEIAETLHLPENRELHEISNVQSVIRLSPIFARIVEQGVRDGVFTVERPLETMQFLFVGTQFLLDGGLFNFTEEELRRRREVAQTIIEKALAARPGSFDFMNPHPKADM